jgi:hypothetical protein
MIRFKEIRFYKQGHISFTSELLQENQISLTIKMAIN